MPSSGPDEAPSHDSETATRPLKVAVALSGGVDSSTAAALLLEQGHQVLGLTARLWRGEASRSSACSGDAVEAAAAAARQLGIPLTIVDCQDVFSAEVLRPCWEAYARGTTPNPCVLCNARVKFGRLLDAARAEGASCLATGHYARLGRSPDGSPQLLRGQDRAKEQSYFLFALTPQQLAAALFPLGELRKEQVRLLARELGLPAAERPESQDACFASGQDGFAEALRQRFGATCREGQLVDTAGTPLGPHRGLHRYTIGQRKGLEVALGQRAYVVAIHPEQNQVVLSTEPAALLASELHVTGIKWLSLPPRSAILGQVQLRYRHLAAPARILPQAENLARVVFATPQRAVTPGQAAVFYQGDLVLGGGWIASCP